VKRFHDFLLPLFVLAGDGRPTDQRVSVSADAFDSKKIAVAFDFFSKIFRNRLFTVGEPSDTAGEGGGD
jgi:hypothetical protein